MGSGRSTWTSGPARPARSAAGPRPTPEPARGARRVPVWRCACGGSCPRCASAAARPAPAAGVDASEFEADRVAHAALQRARTPAGLARAVGVDPHSVRLHTGASAAAAAQAQHANAYTVGSDIVFGAGRFAPHSPAGAFLLAHELAHVAQQRRDGPRLQRQDADVTMPEARISGALRPIDTGVGGLEALTTAPEPGEVRSERSDENAPDPAQRLPFTDGGWESGEILTRLGQFDSMPGTDSDASRCVQAVAMASHVVEGPEAVKQYLNAVLLEAAVSRPQGPRENKARQVLEYFVARIDNREATYGDVSWGQEALHDLFYADTSGTPETDIAGIMAKTFGPERKLQTIDVWCDSPAEVVAQAKALQPGEQLLVVPVTVTFNQALDEASPDPMSAPLDETVVTMADTGRTVRVRRFDASTRPPASAIDRARDKVSGHQMLIVRDASTGELRAYEPEIVGHGDHFMELDGEGRNFERDFRDLPDLQIYGYVQVIAKISPQTPPPRMFAQYRPSWL